MAQPIGALRSAAGLTSAATAASTPPQKELGKDTFLQLMVAQLKNQNPLSPMDGTNFLTQLSQISGVEQMVQMRQELEAIHKDLNTNPSQTGQTANTPGN